MRAWTFAWVSVVQTCLRMFPFPCRTGLIEIGQPGRDAPVLLTGNFRLTVERVKRAMRGTDAFLLVANSRGVNVWCAATGGLLTNHDVVSVLKTSGVGERVDHRHLILPQLAATGIEGQYVRRQTGWQVEWGPVEADAIPEFLRSGRTTTPAMRHVSFGWRHRLEMAVAWAFPISLLGALVALVFAATAAWPLVILVWGASLILFLAFPLYEQRRDQTGITTRSRFFGLGPRGFSVALWCAGTLAFAAVTTIDGSFTWTSMLQWSAIALAVLAVLGLDLMGSTPTYKSGLHDDRRLQISLDGSVCKGAGFCEDVCPLGVFEIDHERRIAVLARAHACVQCGACLVQCPFDALRFEHPDGGMIEPDTIRKFKLNLMGQRLVDTPDDHEGKENENERQT